MTNNVSLTITGMYTAEPTLFDGLQLPVGANPEILIKSILIELQDLEIMYPNPTYLKWAISTWAESRNYAWTRLWAIMELQYNPIHNYDRTEESTTTGSSEGSTELNTVGSNNGTASVRALNSTPDNPFVDTSASKGGSSVKDTGKTQGKDNTKFVSKISGNIGVTTTQQMAASELEFWQWDFYSAVVAEFKKEFCIGVY